MQTLSLVISFILVGIAGYFAIEVYFGYRSATGTTWERLVTASRNSATILLQRAIVVVSAIVGVLAQVADKIDPGLGDTIKSINPTWYLAFTVGLAILSVVARGRTLT